MAFTADELASIANAVLDHKTRGKPVLQHEEAHPLLEDLDSGKKPFAAGKEKLSDAVKGSRTVLLQGYTHNDTVAYQNPKDIKRCEYAWKELHAGITCTFTELKKAGITIEESGPGQKATKHSNREMEVLVDLLEDKVDQMQSDVEKLWAEMLWDDGTADADNVPGIRSFILNDPTAVGTIGGIDQVANTWWRNRFSLSITPSIAEGEHNIAEVLQAEMRQLRRYGGGRVKHKAYAGSDFLEALDRELRLNGSYTQTGWANGASIDLGVASPTLKNVKIVYDPTLDDLSLDKYCFILDLNAIKLRPMSNEDWKKHSPPRPQDQYVMYQGMTWTGALQCLQRNTSGVYSIA
jgi:hypothetical protein